MPSQTELLVDLGLREQVKGVTKFCVHPEDLRAEKMIVGGTKKVNYQRIRDLEPDLVLCNKEENTPEIVRKLEKIAPVHVSDVVTIDDTLDLISDYGRIFSVSRAAQEISSEIQRNRNDFRVYISKIPPKKVAYFIWKNPWMVVGRDSFINHLLELNNFKNVFSDSPSRYPEVDLELFLQQEIDYIFLSTEPFPFNGRHKSDFSELASHGSVHIVDGEFFSWYGSRLIKAFEYFRKLHEEHLRS